MVMFGFVEFAVEAWYSAEPIAPVPAASSSTASARVVSSLNLVAAVVARASYERLALVGELPVVD